MPTSQPAGGSLYDRIFDYIREVPSGRVTTYGRVGLAVGCPARVVGYALHYLRLVERPDVPWQRVVNARGGISTHGSRQQELLEHEGIQFGATGTIDLERFGWP